jgi:Ran GTPase-activating protein 1
MRSLVLTALQVADFSDIFTGRLITGASAPLLPVQARLSSVYAEIPQALSAICDALKDKTSLVEINLSDNAFGGRSVDPMVPFLTHNRSFQILKLNNNGLGPAGGTVIANALLESAKLSEKAGTKSNLRTVVCGRTRLEDGSATAWADAFAAHGTLVDVRMPQNGIREDGIIALARGLSKCPGLQVLDLQDNAFNIDGSDAGTVAMAEALPLWPHLEVLNFSDCVLCNEGEVPALLKVLAAGSHTKLHTLQIQNNNLDTQTAALLAETVSARLPALKRLELQWNEIEEDDEALETLADTLKARGGTLVISDEDEEEEAAAAADEEAEDEEEKQDEAAKPVAEPARSLTDKAADALADLMGKVSLGS